jgi:RND family efflux transporter MFP subunit
VTTVIRVLISIPLILAAFGAAWVATAVLKKTAPQVAREERSAPAQLVETLQLTKQDRVQWIEGFGTAQADQTATLTAEVGAAVVELVNDLEAGVAVTKGQVLVRLDDRQYQQQFRAAREQAAGATAVIEQLAVERDNLEKLIAIAREQADVTESEMRRVKNLFQENHAAESELNRVVLAHQQALQNLQTQQNLLALTGPRKTVLQATRDARLNEAAIAQLNVDRCRITAPFDGQVDAVMVEVGDAVRIGSPIVRLITPARLEIALQVPVSRRNEVTVGAECVLSVDSMDSVQWHGSVCRLSPTADEQSRTFAAYVEVDNARQATQLVPGYFVKAQIKGPLLKDVFVVPRGTIVDGQVYVIRDGKASVRPVTVDKLLRDLAVVNGNIQPGDQIITTNLDVLYDGAPVRTPQDVAAEQTGTSPPSIAGAASASAPAP